MFILAYKLNGRVLDKLLDYVDYGTGPNFDWNEGERSPGFVFKDKNHGYIFLKGR